MVIDLFLLVNHRGGVFVCFMQGGEVLGRWGGGGGAPGPFTFGITGVPVRVPFSLQVFLTIEGSGVQSRRGENTLFLYIVVVVVAVVRPCYR